MTGRTNYSSGAIWEESVGYSRAVRVGNVVEVSGTVATNASNEIEGAGDAYAQTRFIIGKIETALAAAGLSLQNVVRTRMFVTDISRWREYGQAHGEYFRDIRPCTSMLEVKSLIDPACLIEIEATAVIENDRSHEK